MRHAFYDPLKHGVGNRPPGRIDVPELFWEAVGGEDPTDHLLGELVIGGVPMHLEAWAVEYLGADADGCGGTQVLIGNPSPGESDLDYLTLAVSGDGHFDTLEINGREYVLVATPHC